MKKLRTSKRKYFEDKQLKKVTRGIKSRFEYAEETVCELENRSFEMISLRSREKKTK